MAQYCFFKKQQNYNFFLSRFFSIIFFLDFDQWNQHENGYFKKKFHVLLLLFTRILAAAVARKLHRFALLIADSQLDLVDSPLVDLSGFVDSTAHLLWHFSTRGFLHEFSISKKQFQSNKRLDIKTPFLLMNKF